MKKSVVTAIVTTMFVVYSFYQRTVGVEATADVSPGPTTTSGTPVPPQGSGGNSAPAPVASSPRGTARSSSSQARAGNGFAPNPQPAPASAQQSSSPYRDGTYTGTAADAFYGNIQVQATIANGKLTDVQFPQWPNDRSRSVRINQQALPWLVQEAIQAQNARIDAISGATDTSVAFVKSLQSALSKAQG